MDRPHLSCPFTGCDARFRGLNRGWHDVFARLRIFAQRCQRLFHALRVATRTPFVEAVDLFCLDCRVNDHNAAIAGHQRAGLAFLPFVYADNDGFTRFDAVEAGGVGFHQTALHVIDGLNRAAHGFKVRELVTCAVFEFSHLAIHRWVVVEEVVILQEVGLVSHDLLHAHRPLLIPGARQA